MTHGGLLVILEELMNNHELEMIVYNGMDVIYNHNMNGGEWELFDHEGDHIEYMAITDIDECAEYLLGL